MQNLVISLFVVDVLAALGFFIATLGLAVDHLWEAAFFCLIALLILILHATALGGFDAHIRS